MTPALAQLVGTDWTGSGELWLDPLGDKADRYECTLRIEPGAVRYTWQPVHAPTPPRAAT